MPIDVLLQSRESSLRLATEGRVTLEEDLSDFLAGSGRVTGGATADPGIRISFTLNDGVDAQQWLARIRAFLQRWDAPRDAALVVAPDGRRVAVFDGA